MPLASVPAIDANICSGWTEANVNLYNRLPFYLAKMQVERRKVWSTWSKFLGKKRWSPNMGDTMRSVQKEPSPHLRQFANPQLITAAPKKDVVNIYERKVDEQVYRHRFESLVLNFLPDFRDFLNDGVKANSTDVMEKLERFEDIFYRGRVWYYSPYVWVVDRAAGPLVPAPQAIGTEAFAAATQVTTITGANVKNSAWVTAMIPQLGQAGYLSLTTLNTLCTVADNDIGMPPFTGNALPKEDAGLSEKYCLVTSSEAWDQFMYDPFLLNNKNCALDIVLEKFKGSLFGKVTCMIENKPIRFKADGTLAAPETRELNPDAENYGETIPNPDYYDLVQSPYEVAFFIGSQGYEVIEVGPPPSAFASNGMPNGFGKMVWNGEVFLTKNVSVPCPTDDNPYAVETNKYGEYLQVCCQSTFGILGKQKRNIIPILFKRKVGR